MDGMLSYEILPRLTACVNASDYDDGIFIEIIETANVPAWDEWGFPELVGPFETVRHAEDALRSAFSV